MEDTVESVVAWVTKNGKDPNNFKTLLDRLKDEAALPKVTYRVAQTALLAATDSNPELARLCVQPILRMLSHVPPQADKRNISECVLLARVFYRGYRDVMTWPKDIVEIYMADSLSRRRWVDAPELRGFVQNIQTAFTESDPQPVLSRQNTDQTARPNKEDVEMEDVVDEEIVDEEVFDEEVIVDEEEVAGSAGGGTNVSGTAVLGSGSSGSGNNKPALGGGENRGAPSPQVDVIIPRFEDESIRPFIRATTVRVLQPYLTDIPSREAMAMLMITVKLKEVRVMVSRHMEAWLGNAVLAKSAKELLTAVVANCNTTHGEDITTMTNLIRMRLKVGSTLVSEIATKLVQNQKEYGEIALKYFCIECLNQLKGNQNQSGFNPRDNINTIKMLSVVYKAIGDDAEKVSGHVFQMLASHTEFRPHLRGLVRKLFKSLGANLHFHKFCKGLVEDCPEMRVANVNETMREEWIHSLVDLICFTVLMSAASVAPQVATADGSGPQRRIERQIAEVHVEMMQWCHESIFDYLPNCSQNTFSMIVRKLLFLVEPSQYLSQGVAFTDHDKNCLKTLAHELPVSEATLVRVVVMSLTSHALKPADSLDILLRLLQRASQLALKTHHRTMRVENLQLLDAIWTLSFYVPPVKDIQPEIGSKRVVVKTLFWQSCFVVMILSCHNLDTLGKRSWSQQPIMRKLMTMAVTSQWEKSNDMQRMEAEWLQQQRGDIITFENQVARAVAALNREPSVTVTETNSKFLDQLLCVDLLTDDVAIPPDDFLKMLKNFSSHHSLNVVLLKQAKEWNIPEIVLDIMQKDGLVKSLQWLEPLICTDEGMIHVLPLPSLCRLSLANSPLPPTVRKLITQRLNEAVRSEDKQEDGKYLLSFYTQQLHNRSTSIRQKARHVLEELLHVGDSSGDAEMKDVDAMEPKGKVKEETKEKVSKTKENDAESSLHGASLTRESSTDPSRLTRRSLSQLMPYLKSLPAFELTKDDVWQNVLATLETETDLACLHGYATYLWEWCSADVDEKRMSSLATSVASLVSHRPIIASHLLKFDDASCLLSPLAHIVDRAAMQKGKGEGGMGGNNDNEVVSLGKNGAKGKLSLPSGVASSSLVAVSMLQKNSGSVGKLTAKLVKALVADGVLPSVMEGGEMRPCMKEATMRFLVRSVNETLSGAVVKGLSPQQLISVLTENETSSSTIVSAHAAASTIIKDTKSLEQALTVNESKRPGSREKLRKLQRLVLRCQKLAKTGKVKSNLGDVAKDLMLKLQSAPRFGGDMMEVDDASTLSQQSQDRRCVDPKEVDRLKGNILNMSASVIAEITDPEIRHSASKSRFTRGYSYYYELTQSSVAFATDAVSAVRTVLLENSNPDTKVMRGQAKDEGVARATSKLDEHMGARLKESPETVEMDYANVFRLIHSMKSEDSASDNRDKVRASVSRGMEAFRAHLVDTFGKSSAESDQSTHESSRWREGLSTDWLLFVDPDVDSNITFWWLFKEEEKDADTRTRSRHSHKSNNYAGGDVEMEDTDINEEETRAKKRKFDDETDNATDLHPQYRLMNVSSAKSACVSKLVHSGSWRAMIGCMRELLGPASNHMGELNPTVALDFIDSALFNPRSWAGYVSFDRLDNKRTSHFASTPSFFPFQPSNTVRVCNLIISELSQVAALTPSQTIPAVIETRRLRLLHYIVGHNKVNLPALALHLSNTSLSASDNLTRTVSMELLLRMYCSFPCVVSSQCMHITSSTQLALVPQTSQIEQLLHIVVNQLQSPETSQSAFLVCRQLCSRHSALVCRYLPIFEALVEGKASLSSSDFTQRHYHRLFVQIVGVIDALRPFIFQYPMLDSILSKLLQPVLVLKRHDPHYVQLIGKLADFLCFFAVEDLAKASVHAAALKGLSEIYPEVKKIQFLVDLTTRKVSIEDLSALPFTQQQIDDTKRGLSTSSETLFETLSDVYKVSNKAPAAIAVFSDEVRECLMARPNNVRNLAYKVVLRMLPFMSDSSLVMKTFVTCLGHPEKQVRQSALESAVDMYSYSREHSSTILRLIFSMGKGASNELKLLLKLSPAG